MMPESKDLFDLLVSLYAEQENIKIQYILEEQNND